MMVVALVVIAGLYWKFGGTPEVVIPTSTGPAPTAAPNRTQPSRGGSGQVRRGPQTSGTQSSLPQPLKLQEMEAVPEEPQVGRNPFRFGEPPKPPYVPPPPPPPPVYTPPPSPTPPPIPPIPLKLSTCIADQTQPSRWRAYLTDPKTGFTLEGIDGQIIDGRYKLIRINPPASPAGMCSVDMSYLDGTGQRRITIGG